jgi:GntR family transcriptional regulator
METDMTIALARQPALWYQIAQGLQLDFVDRAASGDLRLPTEAELAKSYGVSLLTLRQAMDFLARKGLVDRKRKLGTFVLRDAVMKKEELFLGSISKVFAQQKSDKVDVLERRIVDTPASLRAAFGGERKVCKITRLRYQNGRVTDLAVNHLIRGVARSIDRRMLERMPITQAIHEHSDVKIGHARQELEAGIAPAAVAKQLGVTPLDPVLILTGYTYNDADELIDHARIMYRGDSVRFALTYKS